MTDSGMKDEKIIAIPFSDPNYNMYKSVFDLPTHIFNEMKHFFKVYKELEHKETDVDALRGPDEAKEIIAHTLERYKKYFPR